jgi:hypothetical protein
MGVRGEEGAKPVGGVRLPVTMLNPLKEWRGVRSPATLRR